MTTQMAELFISITVVLLSYFICAPLVGFFRAWTAQEMGDSTPAQLGFLTLNPFMHISRIWLVFIVWLQVLSYTPFGLGRYIPINPLNIQGKNRGFRLASAYFSDTIAALGISIISFFIILAIHGTQGFEFLRKSVTLHNLAMVNIETTTLGIIITWLLLSLFAMGSLIAAFGFIINCFHFMYFYYFENSLQDNQYADMIMLFGPLFLLIFLVGTVRETIVNFVIWIAYSLAYLVGVIH